MHMPVSAITIFTSTLLSAATGYITSRISHHRHISINRRTYLRAILAEVRGLHNRLLEYEAVYANRVLTGQISINQLLKVLLQPGDTVVFTNIASSIGLFDRRTALQVVRFYSDIRILEGRAVVLSEAAASEDSELLKQEMHRHLNELHRVRRRAQILIRHLRARRPLPARIRRSLRWSRRIPTVRETGG